MRLSPLVVWAAHLDGLTRHPTTRPDYLTRAVLLVVPVAVTTVSWSLGAQLRQPGALLAGASLLAGTLLASFGQLATLRGRLTDRPDTRAVALDALDETVAHVLTAVYAALATAAVLGVGTTLSAGAVTGWVAAVGLGLGTWLLLLVLLITPRLYQAYTYAYPVSPKLNPYRRGEVFDAGDDAMQPNRKLSDRP